MCFLLWLMMRVTDWYLFITRHFSCLVIVTVFATALFTCSCRQICPTTSIVLHIQPLTESIIAISQWCKCNYELVFYWWASSWQWIYLPLSMVLNVMCLKGLPLRSCSHLVERISCSFFVRRKLIYLNSRVAVAGEPWMIFSEDLTA